VSLSILRRLPLILFVCLLPAIGSAQHLAHGASGLPHGIPDFGAIDPQATVIPVGESRTLSGVQDFSTLAIKGTVTIANGAAISACTVLVYPGGAVLGGAQGAPISAQITIKDCPLNTTADPEQFGTGFISFGVTRLHGTPIAGNAPRSIVVKSARKDGTRGHVLLTQRADLDIRYVDFVDLGRTKASEPLNSTTFDAAGAVAKIGTNQIGRYALHLHHVMGPEPGSGRPFQFQLVGNRIVGDLKWGLAAHNSHFGWIQDNVCLQSAGVCYVEEDGSETGNQWIGNYAGQPAATTTCSVETYDPEGRCSAGFWLRGSNQVLLNNVVEDMQRGIGWWHGCLEMIGPPCGLDVKVTIPKVPGADTTDVNQIEICKGADGSTGACTVKHRKGLQVDGNILRGTETGLDFWWISRVQNGGPPITNTTFERVRVPLFMHYSDVQYDGIVATGCADFIQQFNDAHPIGFGAAESRVVRATATCTDSVYRRIGQLHQAPLWRITDSTLNVPNGVRLRYGGQRVVGYPEGVFIVERSTMSGQIFTIDTADPESLPEQKIIYSALGVNGQTFTRVLPDGSTVPTPVDCVVSVWSPWSAWTPISNTQEQRTRTRTVLTPASNGGAACPSLTETETRAIAPPPPDPCVVDPLVLTINRNNGWPSSATGSQLRWTANKPARVTFDPLVMPWRATATDARGCAVTVTKP
jgi:hypothetical protein